MSKPSGMKHDLGEFLVSTYGPRGRIVGYLDQPSYIIEDSDGRQHSVAASRVAHVSRPIPTEPGAYQVGRRIAILNRSGYWIDDHGNRIVIAEDGVYGTVYDEPFNRLVPESRSSEGVDRG